MPLTVGELVARPHLRLKVLVAGDLGRVIRWVHASDMPDPAPYLRGDEIVLTAGIWHWSGTAASSFASGLGRANAAALGFGTSALVKDVPPGLADACRAWGLTLFHVPDGISFIEIAEEFVGAHVLEHARPLLDSLERSEQFLRGLQQDRGLAGVLHTLARHRHGGAAVISSRRGVIASTGASPSDGVIGTAAAAAHAESPVDLPGFMAFPIPSGTQEDVLVLAGAIADLSVEERATIDQALAFLTIELHRAAAVSESERRFAAELFDLAAAGDAQQAAVAARLRTFGLDPALPLAAMCCEPVDAEESLSTAEAYLRTQGVRGVAAIKGAQVVGVLQIASGDGFASLAHELHEAMEPGTFVGVGGLVEDARGLRDSLVQARHACRFARRREAGYAAYNALASHALLLELQDEHVLSVFRETLISPLDTHDARHRTELVKTLDRFLGSGGRYRETATSLHVHVNTLRLRLARIEALTGRDLSAMEDRVDLWIALRTRDRGAD